MKKFISILILLVLALPVVVNALVDDDTQVGLYNTLAETDNVALIAIVFASIVPSNDSN